MKKLNTGVVLAFSAGVCWGVMGVAAQYLFDFFSFTPEGLVALRLVAAGAIILLAQSIFCRVNVFRPMLEAQNLRDILLYGLESGLMQYTFFLAIAESNAGTAAVLSGAIPLFLLLWQVKKDRRLPTFIELFSLGLACLGIVLLVTRGDLSSLNFSVMGVAMGLASALFGAMCSEQPKAVLGRLGPVLVTGWGLLAGGLMMLVLSPRGAFTAVWTPESILCCALVVLVGTVFAFVLYLSSLGRIPTPVAGLLSCSEPLTAVVLTAALLGTRFQGAELAGAACIIACVILISRCCGNHSHAN